MSPVPFMAIEFALALCFIETSAQPLAQPSQLPILAWIGPPSDQTSPERYRGLADAGFNLSFSGFPDAASMEHALEVAMAAGVKLMISCPELRNDPEATVRRFKDHPAVAGYYLRDEPSAADFKDLGDPLPRGTRPYQPIPPVKSLDTGEKGAVVSRLRGATYDYLVVVCRELHAPMELKASFAASKRVEVFDPKGQWRLLHSSDTLQGSWRPYRHSDLQRLTHTARWTLRQKPVQ